MLWNAAQWAGNFFETIAAVGLVLLAGAIAAGVGFWIFRRAVGLLADPEPEMDDFDADIDGDPPGPEDSGIITVTAEVPRKNPTGESS